MNYNREIKRLFKKSIKKQHGCISDLYVGYFGIYDVHPFFDVDTDIIVDEVNKNISKKKNVTLKFVNSSDLKNYLEKGYHLSFLPCSLTDVFQEKNGIYYLKVGGFYKVLKRKSN